MSTARFASLCGAICGALAVAIGAFGAHALRDRLDLRGLDVWRTATVYALVHAAALLAAGAAARGADRIALRASSMAFVTGIGLFCGSLYALVLGAPAWIGAMTPVGGLALISGWLLLAWAQLRD